MKKFLTLLAMSLIALSSLVSCIKVTPQSAAGTYNYYSFDFEVSPNTLELEAGASELKSAAKESFTGSSFVLNADNTCTMVLDGFSVPGTYILTESGEISFLLSDDNPIIGGKINNDTLTLSVDLLQIDTFKDTLKAFGAETFNMKVTFKK